MAAGGVVLIGAGVATGILALRGGPKTAPAPHIQTGGAVRPPPAASTPPQTPPPAPATGQSANLAAAAPAPFKLPPGPLTAPVFAPPAPAPAPAAVPAPPTGASARAPAEAAAAALAPAAAEKARLADLADARQKKLQAAADKAKAAQTEATPRPAVVLAATNAAPRPAPPPAALPQPKPHAEPGGITRPFSSRPVAGGSPEFPDSDFYAGKTGQVTVSCRIQETGYPSGCTVLSAKGGLAFKSSVMKWLDSGRVRYAPILHNGQPVAETHEWIVQFNGDQQ